MLFAANPPIIAYPTAPILPPPFPGIPAPGDSTFDNALGVHWFTDGALLAPMPSPSVPLLAPLPAPMPIAPAAIGAIAGPVTGIAMDPAAGVMFMTSVPSIVVGVAPVPGMPVVVPPFPIPFPAGPIAGLEWDGATGSLWAVSVGGVAYNFFPGGAPAGPPMPSAVPVPGPVAMFPVSLATAPVGVTLYNQGFTFCSADPTGFVFSPFQALTIGGL